MIYSKPTYNKITLYSLITAGVILIVLLPLGIVEYRQSEAKLRQEISRLFEQAINEEVKLKMKGEYVDVNIVNDPSVTKEKIGNKTIITEDTTITKETEIETDFNKSLVRNSQTFFLHQNRLHPDTLQQIFNSKLEESGLKVRAVMLVRHGHNTWTSGDTTRYRVSYRMPVVKGGVFGEITYEGLLGYSPSTVFRLMSKSMLIVLFILEVLMLGVIIYLFVEKRKIKPDKIMKRGRYYYIGETIFDIRKSELIGQKKEVVKVTKTPADILLMFLKSDDYIVGKSTLKETFWSDNHYRANQSLMSTMNKLRNYLKEVNCTFSIITKKGDDYYILKYMQEDAEANEAETAT